MIKSKFQISSPNVQNKKEVSKASSLVKLKHSSVLSAPGPAGFFPLSTPMFLEVFCPRAAGAVSLISRYWLGNYVRQTSF